MNGVDGSRAEGQPRLTRRTVLKHLGVTTALVGVATQGGRFPPAWRLLGGQFLIRARKPSDT
jgi:hypothetical protein